MYNKAMNEETFTLENREYLNPQTGLDEATTFIDKFRDIQTQGNQQINQDTYNLGTQTTPNLGGLTGTERLWQARYQTPQVNQTVASLKQQAQQTALNTALGNLQTMWQNRYKQAQRALENAQHNYATRPASSTGTSDVEFVPTEELTDTTVSWEGPSTAIPGATVIGEDQAHVVVTDNKYGVPIDNPAGLNMNEIIKKIESQGHTVTNKMIGIDKDGFLTLNIKTKDGGTDTITINMNSNLTNRGY